MMVLTSVTSVVTFPGQPGPEDLTRPVRPRQGWVGPVENRGRQQARTRRGFQRCDEFSRSRALAALGPMKGISVTSH